MLKMPPIQEILIPDLHDFQLLSLSVGPGTATVRFDLEGNVLEFEAVKPSLVLFDADGQTMYVSHAMMVALDPTDDLTAIELQDGQRTAIRNAFVDTPHRQQLLIVVGLAGIDLLLMGERIEFSREIIPYEEPEVTPEQQARIDSIHAMLTGVVAEHGVEGLKDAKLVAKANRRRGGKV